MKDEARNLIAIVSKARRELEIIQKRTTSAEEELRNYQSRCGHKFQERYDPIHHEGYTCPGDPPGTMGVDWRGPTYVPSETIPRWRRECGECGLVEYTQSTTDKIEKVPNWGTRGREKW